MHVEFLLESLDLLVIERPYNSQSGREDVNSHYYVLAFERMADADALDKQVLRSRSHGHLCPSALQFEL